MRRLMLAVLLCSACEAGCETEWTGVDLALACVVDAGADYMPLACSGSGEVLGAIDHGKIVLADGTVCEVRVVREVKPGEKAFGSDGGE